MGACGMVSGASGGVIVVGFSSAGSEDIPEFFVLLPAPIVRPPLL